MFICHLKNSHVVLKSVSSRLEKGVLKWRRNVVKNHNKKAVQKDPSDLFHETFLHLMVVFKFSIFFRKAITICRQN